MQKVLIIEDDSEIREIERDYLVDAGFTVVEAEDGDEALPVFREENPDLVLLDLNLPYKDGTEVCKEIRNISGAPIIMVTARTKEIDELLGLELGADDYIAKPFSPKVLFSRIKAVLRRNAESDKSHKLIEFEDYTLDIDRYLLKKGADVITITLSEFGILKRLLTNRGKVLTRNQLLDDIHNDDAFVVDRNIDVHIAALRRKLGPNFEWIDTVRGVGYRFKEKALKN